MSSVLHRASARMVRFVLGHKHAEEVGLEALGINIAARLVAMMLCAGAASAAITTLATQPSSVYHPPYVLSLKGAAFTTRHEGVRYHPYNDPSGKPICTVGVGHVLHYSSCTAAELATTYTSAEVTALLMHDVAWAEEGVRARITHPISQPQFDALVDLAFNAGPGSLDWGYSSSLTNTINRGDLAAVPAILARTATTAGGIRLQGLVTRRLDEGALFSRGFYGVGIGYYTPPPPPLVLGRCSGIEWPRPPAMAAVISRASTLCTRSAS